MHRALIFLFMAASSSFAINCDNFGEFVEYNGHYYAVTGKGMSFGDAQATAKADNGYLAIPDDAAENNFLTNLVPGGELLWIGVYDPNFTSNYCYDGATCAHDSSRFKNVNGGAVLYKNWHSSQPDNRVADNDVYDGRQMVTPLGEHWAALAYTGKWYDEGNHISDNNNPVRHMAVFEFDAIPPCYDPPGGTTTTPTGPKCSTDITDTTTGDATGGGGTVYECQTDPNGTPYCPEGLQECTELSDFEDGTSIEHTGTVRDYVLPTTYDVLNVTVGQVGNDYITGQTVPGGPSWYTCSIEPQTAYFVITDLSTIASFRLKHIHYEDWIKITVNGHFIGTAPMGNLGFKGSGNNDRLEVLHWDTNRPIVPQIQYGPDPVNDVKNCRLGLEVDVDKNIDVLPYLHVGTNTIVVETAVRSKGEGWAVFEGEASTGSVTCTGGVCSQAKTGDSNITGGCDTGYTDDGAGGCYKDITYHYYEYECNATYTPKDAGFDTYTKTDPDYTQDNSDTLDDDVNSPTPPTDNCEYKHMACPSNPDRPCAYVSDKWQCSPYPCTGGSSVVSTDTTTGADDAKDNGWDADGNCLGQILFFNGEDMRCRSDDVFGGLSGGGCCDESKVFFGIIECDEDEKVLAKKKIKKLTHYVGKYCSKKVCFIGCTCVQHKKTYCSFNSKLARIIHEQGRPQIGKTWGSAKHPDCKGFTQDEFQKLDFSIINMSEFYADIQAEMDDTLMKNTGTYIQHKMGTMKP